MQVILTWSWNLQVNPHSHESNQRALRMEQSFCAAGPMSSHSNGTKGWHLCVAGLHSTLFQVFKIKTMRKFYQKTQELKACVGKSPESEINWKKHISTNVHIIYQLSIDKASKLRTQFKCETPKHMGEKQ